VWVTLKTNDLAAVAPASFALRVCKALQLKQTRLRPAGANKWLTSFHDNLAIESAIEKANGCRRTWARWKPVLIADCTGRNPNVCYEIGVAHTLGRTVILITQSKDDVPFDLQSIRYILYENAPRGMPLFGQSLKQTLRKELGL
jgi:hypothetical protein